MIVVEKVGDRELDEAIATLLKKVGFTPDKGKGLFIKPNVVIGTGDSSIITSLAVVESLIRYFPGYKITIGGRSAVGIDTHQALERSGYVTLAKKYGVEIVDLGQVARVKVKWKRCYLKLPQLIFLGFKPENSDGIEFLKNIKSDENLRTIPVFIMASSNEQQYVLKSFVLGVAGYVVKSKDCQN